VVDFTKPFLSLGISIIFRIPEDYQPDIFSFLNPLSLEIWVCILLSIFGLTFGMYLVANVTPYEWNLNFSCCTAHQPHPAAQFSSKLATSSTMTRVELSNNYSFWNTLWWARRASPPLLVKSARRAVVLQVRDEHNAEGRL
jgi:hypothetical protein